MYLEHEDLSGGAVDVEHGLVRLVWVHALPGEEVDDVVLAVLVAVVGRHLVGTEEIGDESESGVGRRGARDCQTFSVDLKLGSCLGILADVRRVTRCS